MPFQSTLKCQAASWDSPTTTSPTLPYDTRRAMRASSQVGRHLLHPPLISGGDRGDTKTPKRIVGPLGAGAGQGYQGHNKWPISLPHWASDVAGKHHAAPA